VAGQLESAPPKGSGNQKTKKAPIFAKKGTGIERFDDSVIRH
jgi:hypothetical protein